MEEFASGFCLLWLWPGIPEWEACSLLVEEDDTFNELVKKVSASFFRFVCSVCLFVCCLSQKRPGCLRNGRTVIVSQPQPKRVAWCSPGSIYSANVRWLSVSSPKETSPSGDGEQLRVI